MNMNVADNILEQLDDYQAWKSQKPNFDLIDYLMCVGTADSLIAMMELIRPELIEAHGYFFIKHNFSESVYQAWAERHLDAHEIQRVMNHFHISSFIQEQTVSNEVAVQIAIQLANIWSKLFEDFGLVAEAFGDDFETAQVTLFRRVS